jgi:TolA-binding protein
MTRRRIVLITLLALPILALAQGTGGSAAELLRQGLLLFRQERYQEAVQSFRAVIQDPQAESARPEAYYWAARSYAALNQLPEAEQNLEHFLASYPSHALYPDALYQKGRLLYLQGEPDSAIQILSTYVERYPDNELVSSGYFWIAESLYALGHIDEAARVYAKIVAEYPKSVKLEAARYRISLIEFKQREEELLRLLQWSHQEALKAVEEFERREKAYEQAIAMYQKRLAGGEAGTNREELEALKRDKAALEARVAQLEGRQAAGETQPAGSAGAGGQAEREALLQIMQEALELKQALLNKLAEQTRAKE